MKGLLRAACLAALIITSMSSSRLLADDYPSRPVRLIVPLGAGGPADLVARYLAQQLSERMKASFVVENRPGASGIIGTGEAAKAAPDGYTLLVVASPHINLEVLSHNKSYVLMRDFVAVAPCFSTDAVMVVSNSVPAKTVQEFIALAKSKPGQLTFASSGPGSNKHLGGELFKLLTGTDILHVAYKSSTGARNDVVGGHVDMMFDEVPSVAPNVLAGQVRALGVTGKKRSPALPDIPTVGESVPGYEANTWYGVIAPRNTPADVIDKLNAEINAALKDPGVQKRLVTLGAELDPGTPQAFGKYLEADMTRWAKVIKQAGIKAD